VWGERKLLWLPVGIYGGFAEDEHTMRRFHLCPIAVSLFCLTVNAAKALAKLGISQHRWSRPNPRQMKVNVDGSFHADTYACVVGAVICNYEGHFVAGSTLFIPNVASPAGA
jgi:hypothetical protein